jgi:hypothetical protein
MFQTVVNNWFPIEYALAVAASVASCREATLNA